MVVVAVAVVVVVGGGGAEAAAAAAVVIRSRCRDGGSRLQVAIIANSCNQSKSYCWSVSRRCLNKLNYHVDCCSRCAAMNTDKQPSSIPSSSPPQSLPRLSLSCIV